MDPRWLLLIQFADGSRPLPRERLQWREVKHPGNARIRGRNARGAAPERAAAKHKHRGLRAQLGARIGLADVRLESSDFSPRGPVAIGFENAVPLNLQEPHEIDSKSVLFHRQNEHGVAVGLRDSLPFFLGASDGEQAAKRAQLRDARATPRRISGQLESVEAEKTTWNQQLSELLAEARAVHLVRFVSN